MKQYNNPIVFAAAVALFAAGSLQAEVKSTVASTVTIAATALVQNISTDNGTATVTSSPTKYKINTKSLLASLAKAKYFEGLWKDTYFPPGAKLVMVNTTGSSAVFLVVNKSGSEVYVDVTGIITTNDNASFGSDVFSGKQNDRTGLANPTLTDQKILTFTYDDTNSGGTLKFYLSGLMTEKTTDSAPGGAGHYTESKSYTVDHGAGDGSLQTVPLVITGNLNARGSATLSTVP